MMAYEAPAELLKILVDPETREPVRLASDTELERLRNAVRSGQAKRRNGEKASSNFEGAFLCQNGAVAYVVEGGIPIFLIEQRLEISPMLEFDNTGTPK